MKVLFVLPLFVLLLSNILAQAPDTLWTKTFGGDDIDGNISVQQIPDNGYVDWTGNIVYSQTYYMNVCMKGGATTSIAVQDIRKITFSDITYIKNKQCISVIRTFSLLQNYPNPFNPNTTIEYQIPSAGKAEIKIFDINGKLVKTFERVHQDPGSHLLIWNADNHDNQKVASGLYIYQVSFKNTVLSKKMLFVK